MEPPLLSLDSAINIISHRNAVPPESSIAVCENFDIHHYLHALKAIQQSVSLADYESQAEEAIRMAVARLKHEFLILLIRVTEVTRNPNSTTLSTSIPLSGSTISTGWSSTSVHETYIANDEQFKQEIYNLRSIAEGMKSAGECVEEVYKSARKPFVNTSFKSFGIQKLSVADVRGFVWYELKIEIGTWINAARACVLLLFPRERQLCHGIFENEEEADVCFVGTVKDAVIQLFQFAEAVSTTRRSPEKLFKMLDMYEALVDLSPVVDGVFRNELPLGAPASQRLRDTFAEIVREILSEFEKALFHELSPMTEDDGGGRIHPLTEYAMGYITRMVEEYKEVLSELIMSTPLLSFGDLMVSDAQLKGQTLLAQHLILIIAVLQMKLEGKSKYYKNASLVHFFMTNNIYYIVRCIYYCEAEEVIGEDYMKKLVENLRQSISSYLGSTCERILKCLGEKGDAHTSNCISLAVSRRRHVKKKIKLFNAMLEELLSTQATWGVPDWYFRKVLRSSISNRLIPAYKSFLERFNGHIERRNHGYIKYSVEDLQTLISNNIFLGKSYVDGVIMLEPSGEDKLWTMITGSPRSWFHQDIF